MIYPVDSMFMNMALAYNNLKCI